MQKIFTIIIGLAAAFFVMTVFEYSNSLLFPFPAALDKTNLEQLRSFSLNLPQIAFVIVWLGWAVGAFLAGWVVTKRAISKKQNARDLSLAVGIILTVFGVINNFVFLPGVSPFWFELATLPVFAVSSYLGYHLAKK